MGTFLMRHGQFQIVKYLQADTDPDPIRWGRARARGRCPSLPDIDSLSISRHKKYIYDALGPSLRSRKSTLRHFPGKTMSNCITTTRQQTYRMRICPFVNHHRSRGSCCIPVRHCLPAFPTVYEPDVRCLRLQSTRMFNEIHSQEASWISRTNVMIRIPRSSIAVMIVASNIDEFKNYDGTRGTSTSSNANVPSAISRGVAR